MIGRERELAESDFRHRALRARLLPDGCASRPRDSRRFDACERELEENLECEGEGAAAVDEIARLAEIGLRVRQQQCLRIAKAKKDELLMPPAPHLRIFDRERRLVFSCDSLHHLHVDALACLKLRRAFVRPDSLKGPSRTRGQISPSGAVTESG
jgi:hypothetical protein